MAEANDADSWTSFHTSPLESLGATGSCGLCKGTFRFGELSPGVSVVLKWGEVWWDVCCSGRVTRDTLWCKVQRGNRVTQYDVWGHLTCAAPVPPQVMGMTLLDLPSLEAAETQQCPRKPGRPSSQGQTSPTHHGLPASCGSRSQRPSPLNFKFLLGVPKLAFPNGLLSNISMP